MEPRKREDPRDILGEDLRLNPQLRLCARFDGTSILDFIRYAVAFLITRQQFYEWRM